MRRLAVVVTATLITSMAVSVAQPLPTYDFEGSAKTGTEFPKPVCPAGTKPDLNPVSPNEYAGPPGNSETDLFYRETPNGGVVHLQARQEKRAWVEVTGIVVRYHGNCHP